MGVIRRRGQAIALALAVLGTLLVGVSPTFASGATVSVPRAAVTFLSEITITGDAVLTSDVARVELVLDLKGSTRAVIADVVVDLKPGPVGLSYVFMTPGGALVPGTDIRARFRLVLKDGTRIEGPSTVIPYADTRYQWQTYSGRFVQVHYTDGGAAFGRRAAGIGDEAIRTASSLLGVTETAPIEFFVYADRAAFYDVLGPSARENIGGEAHPEIRTLFANIGPTEIDDPWVGIVIPHELTHLVFDTAAANPYHYAPRWLNEGVAVYLTQGFGSVDRAAVDDAIKAQILMPLEALDGEFPTSREGFLLAYAECSSAVSFIVDHYGRDAMVALIRAYAQGVTDDEAFRQGLGIDFSGFESAWLRAIGSPDPQPRGPVAAALGPAPSAWAGAPLRPGVIPNRSAAAAPLGGPAGSEAPEGGLAVLAVAVAGAVGLGALVRRRRRATP